MEIGIPAAGTTAAVNDSRMTPTFASPATTTSRVAVAPRPNAASTTSRAPQMPLRSIVASRSPSVASTVGSRRVASRTHDEPVFARYSSFHSAIARLLAVPTTPVRDVTRSPSVGVVIVAIGGATAPTAMLTTAGADVY